MTVLLRRIFVLLLILLMCLGAGCAGKNTGTAGSGASGSGAGENCSHVGSNNAGIAAEGRLPRPDASGFAAAVPAVSVPAAPLSKEENASAVPDSAGAKAAASASLVPDDEFEDYGDEDTPVIADPLENWNRFWFKFNDKLLIHVVKPVYKGYSAVTPECLRNGLSNAWHNLLAPVRMLNRILQGEFAMAGVEFGRFVVNTTIGFGGLGKVAEQNRVLVPFEEDGADFGHTLAVWGIGEGCYLVWPFIGPSTVRDTFGLVGDTAASPTFWGCAPIGPVRESAGWISSGVFRFNDLGGVLKSYEALVNSAVEPYSAVRDAYVKLRRIREAK